MSKDTSEPAFPRREEYGDGSCVQHFGLSKREYFAAMAMQGIISATSPGTNLNKQSCAEYAFAMADAMIAEGNK